MTPADDVRELRERLDSCIELAEKADSELVRVPFAIAIAISRALAALEREQDQSAAVRPASTSCGVPGSGVQPAADLSQSAAGKVGRKVASGEATPGPAADPSHPAAGIASLEAEVARLKGDNVEWLCERCNVIHPVQRAGKVFQPCPQCNTAMTATSQNRRRIVSLEAEIARLTQLWQGMGMQRDQARAELDKADKRIADLESQVRDLQSANSSFASNAICCNDWDYCIEPCVPRLEKRIAALEREKAELAKIPREPTEAMIDIGRYFIGPRERVAAFWIAMYDAAREGK